MQTEDKQNSLHKLPRRPEALLQSNVQKSALVNLSVRIEEYFTCTVFFSLIQSWLTIFYTVIYPTCLKSI